MRTSSLELFKLLEPHRASIDRDLVRIAAQIMSIGTADVFIHAGQSDKGQALSGTDMNTHLWIVANQAYGQSGQGISKFGFNMASESGYYDENEADCKLVRVSLDCDINKISDELFVRNNRPVRLRTIERADGTSEDSVRLASWQAPINMARIMGSYAAKIHGA